MKTKESIQDLVPYKANQLKASIVLSANETKNYLFPNGFKFTTDFSKYPNVNSDQLRAVLAKKYNLSTQNIVIGNGSTELLEITVKTYCEKNDTILSFDPSFSMYDIYAKIHGAVLIKVPTDNQFIQSIDLMIQYANKYNPKIIFVCNPNNPTGNLIDKKDIIKLVQSTKSLVVVDEAYMEFASESESVIEDVNQFENLLVARTFSKAYGLASARLGYMIGDRKIITSLLAVKLPYSVNSLSLILGEEALKREKEMKTFISKVIEQRQYLFETLNKLNIQTYPSSGNFIFVKSHENLFDILLKKDILIRSFNNGYFRITVGSETENKQLIKALQEVQYENK